MPAGPELEIAWAADKSAGADDLLYSDQVYYRHEGPKRYFWMLHENVQLLYEPFGWHNEWYIDMVSVTRMDLNGTRCFIVKDAYVDIVVEGMGPTYRIVDLDEVGQALADGVLATAEMGRILIAAQQFLDRYLHRAAPFPPAALVPFFSRDHDYPG